MIHGCASNRLRFLVATVGLAAVAAGAQSVGDVSDRRVQEVHAAARPLDAHVDVLVPTTPEIYRADDGVSQLTIDKLVAGGMATVTFAIQSPTGPATEAGVAAARADGGARCCSVRRHFAADA